MVAYVTKRRETRESRGGLCLDEDEANFFFRQLIWAVQFCHNNHVAHRCAAGIPSLITPIWRNSMHYVSIILPGVSPDPGQNTAMTNRLN